MQGVFTPKDIEGLWICGAKTRSGAPCQNRPMANGRCRMHGGKSLGGIASPRFKHGRYSKYVLARLAGAYLDQHGEATLLMERAA